MPLIALPGWLRRLSWGTFAVALVCGGIIHIAATLLLPRFATGSAFNRLAAQLPANTMRILPPAAAASQPLPFLGPDTRLAVCRFDVSQGPVSVTAQLPDKGWTLGLYTQQGDNFYAVPAQDFRKAEVLFTLVQADERVFGLFNWGRSPDTSAARITVPQTAGLVVVRAPLRGRAYEGETEAVLARASCGAAKP